MKKILHVVGARPNFPKIAPIIAEMRKFPDDFKQVLVHTGQHYDYNMSKIFFEDLDIPQPDDMLEVNGGSHATQTADIMKAFEPVVLKHKPDWVMLVGDVNSTAAAALVCSKLGIPTAHVESGLRSWDRKMPEEINRIITDHLCEILFTSCLDGNKNLENEGISQFNTYFVGNVMIDTLVNMLPKSKNRAILGELNLESVSYILVTLHRPSNVDDEQTLTSILKTLSVLSENHKIIFPIHPRTRKNINALSINPNPKITFLDPLGYLDFLTMMRSASLVLTDSGGVQEETSFLSVPCITLRPNTERPVTLTEGSNRLVRNVEELHEAVIQKLHGKIKPVYIDYWDGKASERIVKIFREEL